MRTFKVVVPALVMGGSVLFASAANAAGASDILGGWTEGVGAFSVAKSGDNSLASAPHHTGRSEEAVINGTTNKRSHGWTTWVGVKHYTRAQMYCPGNWFEDEVIYTDSGRKWGVGGTEAISPWSAYTNDDTSCRPGRARTYYGK